MATLDSDLDRLANQAEQLGRRYRRAVETDPTAPQVEGWALTASYLHEIARSLRRHAEAFAGPPRPGPALLVIDHEGLSGSDLRQLKTALREQCGLAVQQPEAGLYTAELPAATSILTLKSTLFVHGLDLRFRNRAFVARKTGEKHVRVVPFPPPRVGGG